MKAPTARGIQLIQAATPRWSSVQVVSGASSRSRVSGYKLTARFRRITKGLRVNED